MVSKEAEGLPEELRERIDADMARVPGMEFGEMVGYLSAYTGTIADLMLKHNVTQREAWRYADAALERAWKAWEARS